MKTEQQSREYGSARIELVAATIVLPVVVLIAVNFAVLSACPWLLGQ